MTPSNPSLHPTAYSGLRPLTSAGELKRSASLDAHVWPSTTALLNMMHQDTEEGLAA